MTNVPDNFFFYKCIEDLTPSSIVLALGHSFFTLSLGMGTMITYGSYLQKKQNLLHSALWVIALDTAIAMFAGIAIFTTVFALGSDPAGGAGLIFFYITLNLSSARLWFSVGFFIFSFAIYGCAHICYFDFRSSDSIFHRSKRMVTTQSYRAVWIYYYYCGNILFIIIGWWY